MLKILQVKKYRYIKFFLLLISSAIAVTINFSTITATPGLEIVAQFSLNNPPGNIAVTPQGKIILSQHQFFGSPLKVLELLPNGKTKPFPSKTWNKQLNPTEIGLHNVLGLRADKNGIVWLLDNSPAEEQPGKILAWDTIKDRLHRIIYLPATVMVKNSLLNDLAVDLDHNAIYITDTAPGETSALIVVDLKTGFARRVLQGDKSTIAEDIPMVIDGKIIKLGNKIAKVGANPITVAPDNQWLYFAPMSSKSLYRIRTSDLLNTTLTPNQLSQAVQRYGDKAICDGITIDNAGNVYISDITAYGIGVIDKQGNYRLLYQNRKLLSWPNGMAFTPDNTIYVTASQLQNSPVLNSGKNNAKLPFYLLKFPALATGTIGR